MLTLVIEINNGDGGDTDRSLAKLSNLHQSFKQNGVAAPAIIETLGRYGTSF